MKVSSDGYPPPSIIVFRLADDARLWFRVIATRLLPVSPLKQRRWKVSMRFDVVRGSRALVKNLTGPMHSEVRAGVQ